ncbi:MAG TPA: hypothetical protein VM580_15615, partial [Labilithrix sp.]|nr:hypothetical protein [Labilithrix sp.]
MKDFDAPSAPLAGSRRAALDEIVSEAKEHLQVDPNDIDWSRLESRLMASIEEEKPALLRDVEQTAAASSKTGSPGARLRAGALLLAAAAAVALVLRKDRDVALIDTPSVAKDNTPASALRTTEGPGEIRVAGIVAAPGHVVHSGDTIDVEGGRAVFDRPRKVTWLLEQDVKGPGAPAARARMKSAGEALVLSLDRGAIEAQVAPVPSGEAFAIDIATERSLVRVAVHGTHLRVARAGNRVVVDLTEGVVAIGVPPRTGVTYGTTVTAPAHVELDAADLGTLRIDHAPESVRAAIPLGGHEAAVSSHPEGAVLPSNTSNPSVPSEHSMVTPSVAAAKSGSAHAPAAKVEPPKAALAPSDAIAAAVRECAATHQRRSGNVHGSVTSTLHLKLSADGA